MLIAHYNEYYLPNNEFLYRGDYSISRLRSKKTYKRFKQELVRKYGRETIDKQTILYNGVTTCVLAYVNFVNQAGAMYFYEKLIIVASSNVFDYISNDLDIFEEASIWKKLRYQYCNECIYDDVESGIRVFGKRIK